MGGEKWFGGVRPMKSINRDNFIKHHGNPDLQFPTCFPEIPCDHFRTHYSNQQNKLFKNGGPAPTGQLTLLEVRIIHLGKS